MKKGGRVKGTKNLYGVGHKKREMFFFYTKLVNSDKRRGITESIYERILSDFNKEVINSVIFESEKINLPSRIGKIYILKGKRRIVNPDGKVKSIDKKYINWQETFKTGFVQYYFDSPFFHRFIWKTRYSEDYKFIASKYAKDNLSKAINSGVDYFREFKDDN